MSGRWVGITIALALAAPLTWAEGARPRDANESSGAHVSSDAGSRHQGGSSHSGGASHGGSSTVSGRSGSSSDSSSSSRTQTTAQRRHPRAGTGTGDRGHRVYRGGYYYYPYYRSYGSYGYWPYSYGPYGWYGWYGWDSYPGYRYRTYSATGSLRLLVEPSKARVYVDGYYTGVVDDFDGLFQRLNIAPGRHEIVFKLEGYRTHRVRVYVPVDHTIKIHHDMLKGEGEDTVDDTLDQPSREWADRERERDRYRYRDRDSDRDRDGWRERDADRDDDKGEDDDRYAAAPAVRGAGGLRLSVRPDDASVYVDGRWRGTGRDLRELGLPPGRHRVEVVRPGYRTFDTEVEVKADEPVELTVELEKP